ncbi:hypothetical protein B0H16DRAFT_1741755 [Mycena metata]|uniref:Uncharacterized protein n=1 Tax=Mycena metata TaxID=1033252 RepID=A0AAD7H9D2_9AGAR|nr:hypothetical protein B0H16DRAFT_1741755 [Mycena metata]
MLYLYCTDGPQERKIVINSRVYTTLLRKGTHAGKYARLFGGGVCGRAVHMVFRKFSVLGKQCTHDLGRAFEVRECEEEAVRGRIKTDNFIALEPKLAQQDAQDAEHIATGARNDNVVHMNPVAELPNNAREVGAESRGLSSIKRTAGSACGERKIRERYQLVKHTVECGADLNKKDSRHRWKGREQRKFRIDRRLYEEDLGANEVP